MKAEADAGPLRSAPARRPRKHLRFVLLIIAAVFGLGVGLALVDTWRAVGDLRGGRATFHALAEKGLAAGGELHDLARTGAARIEKARVRVHGSVPLSAWARVPFFGRPARWLRGATETAATLSTQASEAVGRIEPGLDSLHDAGARLRFLTLVEREFTGLSRSVEAVRLPASGGFLPPVSTADRDLRNELRALREGLGRGVASARGLRAFLQGPSNYLVLAANNAEMRAGGMVLQAGLLRAKDGSIAAGGFRTTSELLLDEPVPLPREFAALYGWLDPGAEWRNVGSSPNFPAVAPVYAAMARRNGVKQVDGIVQLDVIGVRALLSVIGPVQIGGTRFDETNVDRLVMHDLYIRYGGQQAERRADFSRLAAATFAALNERAWRPSDMVRALRFAAAGRHLLVWSSHAAQQAAWRSMSVDGRLVRDGLMVTVQNHTGNKLDWYVYPRVALSTVSEARGTRRIRARISIVNPTPEGPAGYVNGDGTLVPVGTYRALVAVYLPGTSTDVELPGHSVTLVGPDGPMRVIGTRVDVARGKTVTIDVVFSVPSALRTLRLLPAGRVAPVLVTVSGRRYNDAIASEIAL